MNPIIYACSSREFKRAFGRIMRCQWRRRRRPPQRSFLCELAERNRHVTNISEHFSSAMRRFQASQSKASPARDGSAAQGDGESSAAGAACIESPPAYIDVSGDTTPWILSSTVSPAASIRRSGDNTDAAPASALHAFALQQPCVNAATIDGDKLIDKEADDSRLSGNNCFAADNMRCPSASLDARHTDAGNRSTVTRVKASGCPTADSRNGKQYMLLKAGKHRGSEQAVDALTLHDVAVTNNVQCDNNALSSTAATIALFIEDDDPEDCHQHAVRSGQSAGCVTGDTHQQHYQRPTPTPADHHHQHNSSSSNTHQPVKHTNSGSMALGVPPSYNVTYQPDVWL